MVRIDFSKSLPVFLLALLTIIIYVPSLDVPFVFDDLPNIVLNLDVHATGGSELRQALHSKVSGSRPLAMLSLAVNHWLGGLNTFGYHLFNILIHLLNGILLYQLLLLMPGRQDAARTEADRAEHHGKVAFWAAALWLVNPVQTQAVTYIVQRMTSMATLFYLAGLYLFISWRSGRISARLAIPLLIGCFGLGLACKEILLTFPLALILLDYLFFPEQWRKNRSFLLGLVIFAFFLGVYYLGGNFPEWQVTYPNRNFTPLERVITQWRVLWHYLSLFILPLPERLHLTYNVEVSRGLLSPWTTLPALSAIAASIIAAIRLRAQYPLVSWAILFFFLAAAPEASFVNLELAFIHRLYLPSLFLVYGLIYYLPAGTMKKSGPLFLLLIALWSYWTIARNEEWLNRENFWATNIERGANTARAKNNLATIMIDSGRLDEALVLIDEGLKIVERDEDLKLLSYNRATVYFYQQKYSAALAAFQLVLQKFGSFMNTNLYIGMIYLKQGRINEALALAETLQGHESLRYQGEIIRATIFEEEGRADEAITLLEGSLAREKKSEVYIRQKLQLELARLYLQQNRVAEAYRIFVDITEKFPQNYSVWKMIYRMQMAAGDYENANKIKEFLESRGNRIEKAPSDKEPDGAAH